MSTVNTVNALPYDEDEVLIRFAEAEKPDLGEWTRQYPLMARELARFAAARWADPSTAPTDNAATARVREIGLGAIRSRRATMATTAGITSLVAVAASRGMDGESVAAALDIPFGLFFKLHRRLISPDSIPQKFLAALADTLGRQVEEIAAYLRQPPTLAAGASYRSDDKPTVGDPETFAAALSDDPAVTEAQKARWLA